jgi:hypothetical protein
MKGKTIFTYQEAERIKKLITEKLVSTKEKQKRIRDEIRDLGFYMTDFSNKKRYTVEDFEKAVTIVKYEMAEHTHRFAVWTAARAVQRSFTTTEIINAAIEKSGLKDFVENSKCKSQDDFDAFHEECVRKLITAFKNSKVENGSYGRAAKIIAIYLKTTLVISTQGKDKRCDFIHPPLDRILLRHLPDELKSLKKMAWTGFDKKMYQQVVETIRKTKYSFNWRLEELWKGYQ